MKLSQTTITPSFFEFDAWKQGKLVCGIDEVGRGCLAGPVTVSAVILPHQSATDLLKDSKVLSPQKRDLAYRWIVRNAWYATVSLSAYDVDRFNIYQATKRAMKRAYITLIHRIDLAQLAYIVIDAMPLVIEPAHRAEDCHIYWFTKGESLSPSIAAASIVAKVTRDRLMKNMASYFPAYQFASHKGYASVAHQHALATHHQSIIHRKTFVATVQVNITNAQQPLFG